MIWQISGGFMAERLLLVGFPAIIHLGSHLLRSAEELGLHARLFDVSQAFAGPDWWRRVNWWLRGRRPPRLKAFGQELVAVCREFRPTWVLATGLAPVTADALLQIRELGITCINYLTDDPWNPVFRSSWFLKALPQYDRVYTPRRANLDDLRAARCPQVEYLPFAYFPELHYPQKLPEEEWKGLTSDVLFVGGGDRDRVPLIVPLIRAGFDVALYGGYWERYRETRRHMRGHADPVTVRKATAAAKVTLCLVRRANRDGHVMRSYEAPAMGACMLTEDTAEHREILGPEGEAVVYFGGAGEMVDKLRGLLGHDGERRRLAEAARRRVVAGANTYLDRLLTILSRPRKEGDHTHARESHAGGDSNFGEVLGRRAGQRAGRPGT
jgi:hypothetical protein